MMAITLALVLIYVSLASVASAANDPVVLFLDPKRGSIAGGTMLYVYGSGFAESQFNFIDPNARNSITLVNDIHEVDCQIQQTDVSPTRVACETGKSPTNSEGEYKLVMKVNGRLVTNHCNGECIFTYSVWATPLIQSIDPTWAVPGKPIRVSGKTFTKQVDRLSPDFDPNEMEITRIYAGYPCNPFNVHANELYGADIEDCSSRPICDGHFICLPEVHTAGSHMVSFLVSQIGRSQPEKSILRVNKMQELYNFQTHSDIASVWPTCGSTEGGAVLTIDGWGFSDDVLVTVEGAFCEVLYTTNTVIKCRTGAQPSASLAVHAGSRGFYRQIWLDTTVAELKDILSLGSDDPGYRVEYWPESKSPQLDTFVKTSGYVSMVTGFFVPPQDDNYTFYIISDDRSVLYLSLTGDPADKVKIASCTQASYSWSNAHKSEPIFLEAEKLYYLMALHQDYGSRHYVKIAVHMDRTNHTSATLGAAKDEKQKIIIDSVVQWEKQVLNFSAWDENEKVYEIQKLYLKRLQCVESNISSCESRTDNFTLCYHGDCITLSLMGMNSSVLEEKLNELSTIQEGGRVNVTSIHETEANVTAFFILFAFTDPRSLEVLNGSSADNNTLALNITRIQQGRSAQDFTLLFGNTSSSTLSLSSSAEDIEKALNDLFSKQCEKWLLGQVFYRDFEGEILGTEDGERVSDVESFCGRYSLKNPKILWGAGVSSYTHSEPMTTYTISRFQWVSFAYKGPLHQKIKFRIKYTRDDGQEGEMTRWYPLEQPPSLVSWRFYQQNVWVKLKEEFGDTIAAQRNFKMYRIEISHEQGSDGDIFVDEVYLGRNQFSATPTRSAAMPNGLIIKDFAVERTSERNWTICLLPGNCGFPLPLIDVEGTSRGETSTDNSALLTVEGLESTVQVRRIQEASPPIQGAFDIECGNGKVVQDIPFNISEARLQDQLDECEEGDILVECTGHCAFSEFKLTFTTKGGNHPKVTVNSDGLTGNRVTVTVRTLQEGGLFMDPIPGEFLRVLASQPQVVVTVNGIIGSCLGDNCSFEYSSAKTPQITNISPKLGPGGPAGIGTVVSIGGTGFSRDITDNMVTIAGSNCDVISSTAELITCRAGYGPGGTHLVHVRVDNKGFAANTQQVRFTYVISASSVSPNAGSIAGGQVITIFGSGYGNLKENASVSLGGSTCIILNINMSRIQCRTTAHSNGVVSVDITVDDSSVQLNNAYQYDSSSTAFVTGVSPREAGVIGGNNVNVSGSGFTDATRVLVGDKECVIQSLTAVQIVCTTPPHAPGKVPIHVITTGFGFAVIADNLDKFEYVYEVTQIYPLTGSWEGGTKLTLIGRGLCVDGIQSAVTIKDRPCTVISCNWTVLICVSADNHETIHITNGGVHPVYGRGYKWDPQRVKIIEGDTVEWRWAGQGLYNVFQTADASMTVYDERGFISSKSKSGIFQQTFKKPGVYYYAGDGTVLMKGVVTVLPMVNSSGPISVQLNGTEALYHVSSPPNHPPTCETGVIDSISGCSTPLVASILDSGRFEFSYWDCTTPRVTSVFPSTGTSDAVLFVVGRGFSDTSCHNKVNFGSDPCIVTSSNASVIVCQLDESSLPQGGIKNDVSLQVVNRGYAMVSAHDGESIHFVLRPTIANLYPAEGSKMGGTWIEISGDGFAENNDDNLVVIGDNPCDVIASSPASITCVTQASNLDGEQDVTVFVSGSRSECSDNAQCQFTFSDSSTPAVTSMSPPLVSLPDTEFRFLMSCLPSDEADVTITIGEKVCNVTKLLDDRVKCKLLGIPAGNHTVNIHISGKGNALFEGVANIVHSKAILTSLDPTQSSFNGGATLIIVGNGFDPDQTTVTIEGAPCGILTVSYHEIRCVIPPNPDVSSATVQVTVNKDSPEGKILFPEDYIVYNNAATPQATSLSQSSGKGGDIITIFGSRLGPLYDEVIVDIGGASCTVNKSSYDSVVCNLTAQPAGIYGVSLLVPGKGLATSELSFTFVLSVDTVNPTVSGFGGGRELLLRGSGFDTSAVVLICGNKCTLNTDHVTTTTELACEAPMNPNFDSGGDEICNVEVHVNGERSVLANSFTYRSDLTSWITSVTPSRGGTGGGTELTICGTGFSVTQIDNAVTIDGTWCTVTFSNSTVIQCTTDAHNRTIETMVRVDVGDNGKSLNEDGSYFYVDVWSSNFTWGYQNQPTEGDFVVIEEGQTILLDVDTPILKMLLIKGGKLIFDHDQPSLHLQAENILITDNGALQVGTEENPFPGKACITLHGHVRSREIPVFGAKSLALREGTLDLHGLPVEVTWTYLNITAEAGSSELHLMQRVSWKKGDEIVLAPTGKSQREHEELTITAVSNDGMTLHITPALRYRHICIVQMFESGHVVKTCAEVGLLTRNVKIKGSKHTMWKEDIKACEKNFQPGQFQTQTCFLGKFGDDIGSDEFGVSIMIHAPSESMELVTARFSYVEVSHAGQAFRLGRYPIHFHLSGDVEGSYVRGCAIHHSFNRAITMHGIHNLHVSHNVVFNVKGNAYFMEDGIETGNTVEYNLGIFVISSSSALNVDITPATYWVTNANNTVRHNVAAGGSHFGFWYQMFKNPDGPSFTRHYCPRNVPMLEFKNNSAHSFGRYGLWVFPVYHPKIGGQCNSYLAEPAKFYSLTAWNNMRGAEAVLVGAVQMIDFQLLDNDIAGIEYVEGDSDDAPWGGPKIKDALIVGHSNASQGVELLVRSNTRCTSSGIRLPKSMKMVVEGVTFVNFDQPECKCYATCAQCKEFHLKGGWESRTSGNRFINSPNIVAFEWNFEAVICDLDGSITGVVNGKVVPTNLNLPPRNCRQLPQFSCGPYPGSVCNSTVKFIRFAFNQATPDSLNGKNALFRNQHGTSVVPFSFKAKTHPSGWMALLIVGEEYALEFENAAQITNITYFGTFYEMENEDHVWISHLLTQTPDHFTTTGNYQNMTDVRPRYDADHGNWSFINETKEFTYIASGRNGDRTENNNIVPRNINPIVYRCRYTDCIPPVPPPPPQGRPADFLRWSVPEAWDGTAPGFGGYGRRLPTNGSDVEILKEWYMLADMQFPYLNKLFVYGTLEIEDRRGEEMVLNVSFLFVSGAFIVGWPGEPYRSNFRLSLQGDQHSEDMPMEDANLGSKFIGVFGFLWLHGKPRDVYWTNLNETANVGDSTIVVAEPVDWERGDQIVIASTSVEPQETEIYTIESVYPDKQTLNLNGTIQYQHLGVIHSAMGWTYCKTAEVGLLTRNIVIEGADNPAGAWDQSFGARVLITRAVVDNIEHTGSARIENVEFNRCGQEGFTDSESDKAYDPRYGLAFLNTGDIKGNTSYVRGNSFHHCFNTGIGVFETNNLTIEDNVVHHTVGPAIRAAGMWNRIIRNLAVYSISIHTYNGRRDPVNEHWPGAIETFEGTEITLINNTIAGSERFGYKIDGEKCHSSTCRDYGNVVHGAWYGVLLHYNEGVSPCTLICGYRTWGNLDYGIFTYARHNLEIRDVISVDNTVGILPNVYGPHALTHRAVDKHVTVRNTLIVGTSPSYECEVNKPYARRAYGGIGAKKAPGGGNIGITMTYFGSVSANGPIMAWESPMSYPALYGCTLYDNVTFAEFKETCGKHHRAIMTSSWIGDIFHPVEVRGLQFDSVDDGCRLYFSVPSFQWVNPSDCVDMDCDARRQAVITDLDGSLTGNVNGTVIPMAEFQWGGDQRFGLGDYRIPKPALTDVDGTRLYISDVAPFKGITRGTPDASTCSWYKPWNAYTCTGLKHRMLIIESLDDDTETRRLSPVALIGNGYVNLLNGPMDHGWCLGYTCQERISTFYGIVAANVNYSLYFTSTEPHKLRFHLLKAEEDDSLRLEIFYKLPQRQDVYKNGVYILPTNGRFDGDDLIYIPKPAGAADDYFVPQLTNISGSNYFDRELSTLFLVLRGSNPVEIRMQPVVMVQIGMKGVSIDDFFKTNLVHNLASLLGIDASRIRVANIVREDGSARRRREVDEVVSIVNIEISDPPVSSNNSQPAEGSSPEASQTAPFEELNQLGAQLVEKAQSGEMAEQIQVEVVSLSVTDAIPPPVDPTGGVRATNETGGPNVTDNSTLRYDELQAQREAEAPSNVFSYLIPSRLVVVTEPGGGNETVPFTIQPRIKIVDINDQLVTQLGHGSFTNWTATASIKNGTGDPLARLEGNITVTFVNGWANFTDLSITHNGSDYSLVFNVSKPTAAKFNATSQPFEVRERILYFIVTAQPADANETVSLGQQPRIEVRDAANGAIVDNTGWKGRQWLFTASIANPDDNDGNLNGTTQVEFDSGIAEFTDLSIDISGENYILNLGAETEPSSRYFFSDNSSAFNVSERIFYLKLAQQPGDCNDTVICGQQPVVEVRNVFPDTVVENIGWRGRNWYLNATMDGNINSLLNGSTFLSIPTLGRVKFQNLNFYDVGEAYRMKFTVTTEPSSSYSGLSVTSGLFDVAQRQFYLHVITQPALANQSELFGIYPVVEIRDIGTGMRGYPLKGDWSINVTLKPSALNGTLGGMLNVTVQDERAEFINLSISFYGVGYVLTFESNYGHTVDSQPFEIRYVNDFSPVFDPPSGFYNATVSEDSPIGSSITQVTATDQDSGSQGEVSFSIVDGDTGNLFEINSTTGVISTIGDLDRETTAFFTLTVRASDRAVPEKVRFTDGIVEVAILDVNDNAPSFNTSSIVATVGEDAGMGDVIILVQATDPDAGMNANIQYSILRGNNAGLFDIDIATGEVKVNSSLDLDQESRPDFDHSLVIFAKDMGTPSYNSSVVLNISITEVNEFTPQLLHQSTFNFSFPENTPVVDGVHVVQVNATDQDYGEQGRVSFVISSGNKEGKFFLNTTTGLLSLNSSLDYETAPFYTVVIHARDHDNTGNVRRSVYTVYVTVIDLNDNAPTFNQSQYEVSVDEDTAVGSVVFTFLASDPDGGLNGIVTYTIIAGNYSELWSLNSSTGELAVNALLDMDSRNLTEWSHRLVVMAQDSGTPLLDSNTTLVIIVIPINEFVPSFLSSDVSVVVDEDIEVGGFVYQAIATDADYGSDGEIGYSFTGGNTDLKFYIDSTSGNITTDAEVDREVQDVYHLIVRATDTAALGQRKWGETTVHVSLRDVNDNAPSFDRNFFSQLVNEDLAVGEEVLRVQASDPDLGTNGDLVYSISSGNDDGFFGIEYVQGIIRVAKNLDIETQNHTTDFIYNLVVFVTDKGTPIPMNNSVLVMLTVQSVNEFTPVLQHADDVIIEISENTTVPTVIYDVNATDQDYGAEGQLTYIITEGNNLGTFAIGETTGVITLVKELDYETVSQHILTITVSDNSDVESDRRTVTIRLEIRVLNLNDSAQYSTAARILQNIIASPMNDAALARVPTESALEVLLVYENGTTMNITRRTDLFTLDDTSKSNNLFTITILDGAPYVLANSHGSSGEGKLLVLVTNVGVVEVNVTVVGSTALTASATMYPDVPGAAEVTELKQVTMGRYQRVLIKVFLTLSNGDMVEVSSLPNTTFSLTNAHQVGGTFGFGPDPQNLFSIDGIDLSGAVVLQAAFASHLSNTVNLSLSTSFLEVMEISRLGLQGVNSTFRGVVRVQKGFLFAEVRVADGSFHRLDNLTFYSGLFQFSSSNASVASVDVTSGVVTLLSESSYLVTITATLTENASVSSSFSFYCNLEPDVGGIDIGATEGPGIPSLSRGDIWRVPVWLNPGMRGILALHVEIWFNDNDLNFVNITTDLPYSVVSNTIKIFGPLALGEVFNKYVGEIVFIGKRSGVPVIIIQYSRTVDKELMTVPPKAQTSCSNTVLGDIDLDCFFDIVDVAFIGAYIASSKSQFQDAVGNQMKGLTSHQMTSMDANWNDAVEIDDAILLSKIYLGMAKFVTELTLFIPSSGRSSSDRCSLEFTVKLANKDGTTVAPSQVDVYFVFSSSSGGVRDQLNKTSFSVGIKYTTVDSSSSIIGVVKASHSDNSDQLTIVALSSHLDGEGIGVSLVQLVQFHGQTVAVPMFTTSSPIYNHEVDVYFDNDVQLQVSGGYTPQRMIEFSESTERCNDPLVTINLEIVFEGNYDIVRGNEEQFAVNVNLTLTKLYVGIIFSNFRFREGSVVTTFDMTLPESEKDPTLTKMWADVQDGLEVEFGGSTLTTLPKMKADGEDFATRAAQPDSESPPIYIVVIGSVAAFLVTLVLVIVVYLLFRRRERKVMPSPPETPVLYSDEKSSKQLITARYLPSAKMTPHSSSQELRSPKPPTFVVFHDSRGKKHDGNKEILSETSGPIPGESPPPSKPMLGFAVMPPRSSLSSSFGSGLRKGSATSLTSGNSMDKDTNETSVDADWRRSSSLPQVEPAFNPRVSSSSSSHSDSSSSKAFYNVAQEDDQFDDDFAEEVIYHDELTVRRRASSVDSEPIPLPLPGVLISQETKNKRQKMQIKVIRPNVEMGVLAHVAGVVKVNPSGSLQDLRHDINTFLPRYLGALRYLFLSRKFKVIDPQLENQLVVSGVYKKTVYVKVFHGTENCEYFCLCGKVATVWCAKCNVQGYCGDACRQGDEASHSKFCSRKRSRTMEFVRTSTLTRKEATTTK